MNLTLDRVAENRMLSRWGELLDRCPQQLGAIHEADAELVALPGGDRLLAVTVDTIAEEIALGLYRQPETIGWMGATASLSDLAAVGAEPLGLLVSVSIPHGVDEAFQEGVARGLAAACRAAGTYVLGGDTNRAECASVTGCAIGTVARSGALRRIGCSPGDWVYTTGLLGAGAAMAARAVLGLGAQLGMEDDFRPRARLREAATLAPFVTAAMDTSDGLVTTLDQLSRLNSVGFAIDAADLLEAGAERICQALGVPAVAMLAAHHGEFELVLTVADSQRDRFEQAAAAGGLAPRCIGHALARAGLWFDGRELDGARIRNLADEHGSDVSRYLQELLRAVGGS